MTRAQARVKNGRCSLWFVKREPTSKVTLDPGLEEQLTFNDPWVPVRHIGAVASDEHELAAEDHRAQSDRDEQFTPSRMDQVYEVSWYARVIGQSGRADWKQAEDRVNLRALFTVGPTLPGIALPGL